MEEVSLQRYGIKTPMHWDVCFFSPWVLKMKGEFFFKASGPPKKKIPRFGKKNAGQRKLGEFLD